MTTVSLRARASVPLTALAGVLILRAALEHWQAHGWEAALLVLSAACLAYRFYDLCLRRLEEGKKRAIETADWHLRTLEALAPVFEAKDHIAHHHLRRVRAYAQVLGRRLGLRSEQLRALEVAALLHDIGKLAVPDHILSKPGKLTPEEFEKIKIHSVVGAQVLEPVPFPYPVVPIVRSHHERWDGSGYPDGLRGEEIPLGARILTVADCLDALASDRRYRRAYPLPEALEMVFAQSGKSFDPRVVATLEQCYPEIRQIHRAPMEDIRPAFHARIERGEGPAAGYEITAIPLDGRALADFSSSLATARQEFHKLVDMLNHLGSALNAQETLALLAARLKPMVPHDTMAIYACRQDKLVPQLVSGEEFRLFSSLEIPVGQGLSGWVAENRRPIVNGNPSVEPGYLDDPSKSSRMRSALAVPLEGAAGLTGVLTLYHSESDAFSKDHLRLLLAVSPNAGLALENALQCRQAVVPS